MASGNKQYLNFNVTTEQESPIEAMLQYQYSYANLAILTNS